ncbi:MAG: hypothetical protein MJ238_05860 [Bacilli bacterium]|nr:hypothetical protein [Bacilli bacterium]
MANKVDMFITQYRFYGDYARMADDLTNKIDLKSGATIFSTNVDLFIVSSIVGVIKGEKGKPQTSGKDSSIFPDAFRTHWTQLKNAFTFVLLNGNTNTYNKVERLNKAFRNPETEQNYIEFEEYMLGGLVDIHEHLFLKDGGMFLDYLAAITQYTSSFEKPSDSAEEEDIFADLDDE